MNSYAYFEFVYRYLHITRANELYQEKKKSILQGYLGDLFESLHVKWKDTRLRKT